MYFIRFSFPATTTQGDAFRLSSLTQPNEEQTHPSPEPWKNVLEQNEGITDQRSSVLANDEVRVVTI